MSAVVVDITARLADRAANRFLEERIFGADRAAPRTAQEYAEDRAFAAGVAEGRRLEAEERPVLADATIAAAEAAGFQAGLDARRRRQRSRPVPGYLRLVGGAG